jgi:hypothetical protein
MENKKRRGAAYRTLRSKRLIPIEIEIFVYEKTAFEKGYSPVPTLR